MYRSILILTCCTILLAMGSLARAGQQCDGHFRAVCPSCHNGCTLKAECGKEKKECFEVECEQICIPRVVFPWQKWKAKRNGQDACDTCTGGCDSCDDGCGGKCSSVNNGAKTKTVKKLKKKSYECPTCKYEWVPAGNCGCASGNCSDPNGCDAGCDAPALPADAAQESAQAFNIPVPALDSRPGMPVRKNRLAPPLQPVVKRSLSDI